MGHSGSGATATGSWPAPAARGRLWPWLLLLLPLSLFPNLGAALPRLTYFYRDFTVAFYPWRLFAARELAAGRWPAWNPYVHEGTFAPPQVYPVDLLHVFAPAPEWVSWLLTLHFPLAAGAAFVLARHLGARPVGAFAAGAVYALGGLALSSLNLYVYLQALAWAPLVVWGLLRAPLGGGRRVGVAALAVGLATTTLAVEFVAQALTLGLLLALLARPGRAGLLRNGAVVVLGLGLAGLPIAVVLGFLAEAARGSGTANAMDFAVHPLALLQIIVPGFFGPTGSIGEVWWGHGITGGLPYFLSLYLGALTLAAAGAGLGALPRPIAWALAGAVLAALWFSLGARGGLAPLLLQLPFLRMVRFPVKAFFTVHLAVAVLAGLGVSRLAEGAGEAWRSFLRGAGAFGLLLLALAASVPFVPLEIIQAAFGIGPRTAGLARDGVVRDALLVAVVALAGGALAALVRRGRLRPTLGAGLVATLMALDLGRAGAGMNRQTDPTFYAPLPGLAPAVSDVESGRVFVYARFGEVLRRVRPEQRIVWSFLAYRRLLVPYTNMIDAVEVAESPDVTGGSIPRAPSLPRDDLQPERLDHILPRLRDAAVSRVLSYEPVAHRDLSLRASLPAGPEDLTLYVYALRGAGPRAYVACRVLPAPPERAYERPLLPEFDLARDVSLAEPARAECTRAIARRLVAFPGDEAYEVEADGPGVLVVRASFARGWRAEVDGAAAPVLRANGRHQAVAVPAGRHHVRLRYRAPGLRLGLAVTAAAAVTVFTLLAWPASWPPPTRLAFPRERKAAPPAHGKRE